MTRLITTTLAIAAFQISILSQTPDLIWGGTMANISMTALDSYSSAAMDSDSNLILVGHFSDGFDFDYAAPYTFVSPPGGGSNQYDIFIQKTSSSGQLLWVKTIGGSGNEFSTTTHVNSNNEIIVTGSFDGTVDFDPSPNTFNLTSSALNSDIFILKLDTNGDFVWVKSLQGTGNNKVNGSESTSNNDIVLAGHYQANIDFDPGIGSQSSTANGSSDNFILKLDSNGDYVWSTSYGGADLEEINSLALNQAGEIFVAGEFQGAFVTSPGPGMVLNSNGLTDCFIQKYTSNGNHIWSKSFGSSTEDQLTSLSFNGNSVVASGFFTSTTDFDPSPSISEIIPLGENDIYLLKLDDTGVFSWAKSIEYSDLGWWETPCFTAMNEIGEVYLSGPTSHNNVDLNPGIETFYLANHRPYTEPILPHPEWINQFIVKLDANGDFLNASSINSQTIVTGGEVASKGLIVVKERIIMYGISNQNEGLIDLNISPYLEADYASYSWSPNPFLYVSVCSEFNDTIHYINNNVDNIDGDTLHIHSIATARQSSASGGYTLDGIHMINSRAKLLNPDHFGPTGIYPKKIIIHDDFANSNDCTLATDLPEDDIFFFGAFNIDDTSTNQFTTQEIDSLYEWSLRGGKMIHTSFGDSSYILTSTFPPFVDTIDVNQNILASKWSVSFVEDVPSYILPTVEGMKTDLFREGPFGSVNVAFQAGDLQGHFESLNPNDQVYATDGNGNPTLFMDCETLDLMIADMDVYSNIGNISQGDSIYGATDRFWLNTVAFMDQLQVLPVLSSSGESLILNDNYVAYQWYADNEFVSDDSNFSPDKAGNYHVIVSFNGGCQMSSNSLFMHDSVFANIAELDILEKFSIYPNPSNDTFTIDFGGPLTSEATIKVTDVSGNMILSFKQSENKAILDMGKFPKGVYILIAEQKSQTINKKLIRL